MIRAGIAVAPEQGAQPQAEAPQAAAETGAGAVVVTSDPDTVRRASRVVLPGDGAFPACQKELYDHRGLFEAIEEAVIKGGRPFMGICIGMQMMATRGLEYTETAGFDWIPGTVAAISPSDPSLKIPHMGWNDLILDHPHPIFAGIDTGHHDRDVMAEGFPDRMKDDRRSAIDALYDAKRLGQPPRSVAQHRAVAARGRCGGAGGAGGLVRDDRCRLGCQ